MRLLLLATMASAIAANTTYAHSHVPSNEAVIQPHLKDTIIFDTLQLIYRNINLMSDFELKKWRESYIYKNRVQPSSQNEQILLYIEERLKVVK
jgi:hypothetical protein